LRIPLPEDGSAAVENMVRSPLSTAAIFRDPFSHHKAMGLSTTFTVQATIAATCHFMPAFSGDDLCAGSSANSALTRDRQDAADGTAHLFRSACRRKFCPAIQRDATGPGSTSAEAIRLPRRATRWQRAQYGAYGRRETKLADVASAAFRAS